MSRPLQRILEDLLDLSNELATMTDEIADDQLAGTEVGNIAALVALVMLVIDKGEALDMMMFMLPFMLQRGYASHG